MTEKQESADPKGNPLPHQRARVLWRMALFFIVVSLISLALWVFWLRFVEMTLDAYVGGNQVRLTPQVDGIVSSIWADDADYVKQGQILVELDKTDASIALENAKGYLGQTVRDVASMFEEVYRLKSVVVMRQADLYQREVDYCDRKALVASGAVSTEDFIHAEMNYVAATAALDESRAALKQAMIAVEGTTVRSHPLVIQASEKLAQRVVDFSRCVILSPSDGIITQRLVQVGQQVKKGDPLLAIVPMNQIWVNANFKESHLSKIRVGQPVKLYSDIYGLEIAYKGRVVGLVGGTGAVFSVLPPQNATGNWVKIVQRLTVRVDLDEEQLKEFPLRLGLSMFAIVDVSDQSGLRIPEKVAQQPLYSSYIYPAQEDGAMQMIEAIIEENLPDPQLLTLIEDAVMQNIG